VVTSRLNGKVGRSHSIGPEEFGRLLDGAVIDDAGVINTKIKEWEDYDNYHRLRGGLGGRPLRATATETQAQPFTNQPQQRNCRAEGTRIPDTVDANDMHSMEPSPGPPSNPASHGTL
jgi:hypothetical protein